MKLEVLSPAGSMDALVAAVRCGADAVYMGLQAFNARRNASNFSDEEFADAVSLCKRSGVNVYLVLNTIIKENEMNDAVNAAIFAAKAGVSAIIVQDLGLAAELHRVLPGLPLHASTQLSVHSPSALKLLKELGFTRVVPAREMSKNELTAFCSRAKELAIEVEVFVHGALCMSVSGQCYFSATLGGRSANRGLCAGTCRLPFKAKGGTGYDLSLKDLSLIEHIKELHEIGVCSLKIEGRMKRAEYVAVSTAVCRSAVDTGKVPEDLSLMLKDVFSRSGFTNGYFTGKLGRQMFGVRTEENAAASAAAFRKIHELYRRERSSVSVTAELSVKSGQPVTLAFSDANNTVTVNGELPLLTENRPLTAEFAKAQLGKLGGTVYHLESLDCKLDSGLTVGAGELGTLRRKAVEILDAIRSKPKPTVPVHYSYGGDRVKKPKKQKVFLRLQNPSQIPDDLSGIWAVCLPMGHWEESFPGKCSAEMVAEIPRGMSNEAAVKKALLKAKENGFTAALCGNLAAFTLAEEVGLPIISSFGMNIFNSAALQTVAGLGANSAVLSPELSSSALPFITGDVPKGVFCYGRLPLMLTRNCPVKNGSDCASCRKEMSDRTGRSFQVVCGNGYSELLNSYPVWMGDRLEELETVDFLFFYFTTETKEEVRQVIEDYKKGSAPKGEFTRGMFRSGVK